MAIILDIETIPQETDRVEKAMPEEIRNPQMPFELAHPEEPNWEEKAPAYSVPTLRTAHETAQKAAAAVATDKDAHPKAVAKMTAAAEKLAEAEEKRKKWIADSKKKFADKLAFDRQKWETGTREARWKFIADAALDARLGYTKLIGTRNTEDGISRIFIWEPRKEVIALIRKWFAGLPKHKDASGAKDVRDWRGKGLILHEYREEKKMLADFLAHFADQMDPTGGERTGGLMSREDTYSPRCVTYYGNQFDFRFLYQRMWILGSPAIPLFRRGRYWEERIVDLHEWWTFGDRQARSGGLDGLARSLGCEAEKIADAKSFAEWYEKDPVDGIVYLIGDLDLTEYAGLKMGAIH